MTVDREEYDRRKKAIFDGMSKRGQERILRIGYENWEPFQEPKDPRERIYSSLSIKANELLKEFYGSRPAHEESVTLNKELFELCRGLLQGERRAQVILEFCCWLKENLP
jgi:hypothetical protein